jgi:hypothetical protein
VLNFDVLDFFGSDSWPNAVAVVELDVMSV